ncbi:MAG: hypothetical protein WKG00_05200 [Polyangiaceae bacterium]
MRSLLIGPVVLALFLSGGAGAHGSEDDLPGTEDADQGGVSEVMQELFIGEMVHAQEQWELQGTAAGAWTHRTHSDALEAPLTLELGLTDRLQIAVEVPLLHERDGDRGQTGLGNVAGSVLYNALSQGTTGRAVSFGIEGAAPAVSDDVGEDAVLLEPFVIGYLASGALALNASVAMEVAVSTQRRDTELGVELVLAALFPRGALVPSVEAGVAVDDGQFSFVLAPGLTGRLSDSVEVGAAAGARVDDAGDPALLAALHVTWEGSLSGRD